MLAVASLFAQTPASVPAWTINDPAKQAAFDKAYLAAQPPEIGALMAMDPADPQRAALAQQLAPTHVIDVPVQVWGWDAFATMRQRLVDDLKWVPSALQPSICLAVPTASNPPYCPYDATKAPAGSIKVSIDPADFPAFQAPAPLPPTPAGAVWVGAQSFGNVYQAGPAVQISGARVNVNPGQQIQQGGATYTAHVENGLFGLVVWFSKN